MTTELRFLLFTAVLTGALWIPVVIGYVTSRGALRPVDYRTAPVSPLPDWVNRANRAHMNAVESFAPFAAAVLVARFAGISTAVTAAAACVFFGARVLHAVLHVSGFQSFRARTVVFTVGWCAFTAFAVEVLRQSA